MIPKTIHYCWFGRGEKPESVLKYIRGWHEILPDYSFKEWNEDNFDVNSNQYVKEAYECRRFAFVSDYVRLYALYNEGGVYMDTDVEILSTFNPFLLHSAFAGFEKNGNVNTGMMAAEKGSAWIKGLLSVYDDRKFILQNGTHDTTTNPTVITKQMVEKGLILNHQYQDFPGFYTIYPAEYFSPKDHRTGKIRCTPNTVCIHHYAGSWLNQNLFSKLRHTLKVRMTHLLGEKTSILLSDIVTLRNFRKPY